VLAACCKCPARFLFLDEPTLGLDVNAQPGFVSFSPNLQPPPWRHVLLTSHYMAEHHASAARGVADPPGASPL